MKPRITILPSLWLGGHNLSHLSLVLRRGLDPNPRPFPSPGEGMQPLASARSVTKVGTPLIAVRIAHVLVQELEKGPLAAAEGGLLLVVYKELAARCQNLGF